jgi:TPR repeat protein
MLETGSNGVTKDQARARELYQRAAKAGHPGARAKLRDKAPGL